MAITLTSTDDLVTEPERTTRALVQGWTTDIAGTRKFVALKYDAERVPAFPPTNKDQLWAKIQEWPTMGQQTPVGIVHRMIDEPPFGRLLNFFSTGSTLIGASGYDWETFRFREICEQGCP